MKALICDLDGTLVDSVYAHVLARQAALAEAGMPIEGWRLHRPMGMSGGLSKRGVMRELGRTISLPRLTALDLAAKEYAAAAVSASQTPQVRDAPSRARQETLASRRALWLIGAFGGAAAFPRKPKFRHED